MYFHFPGGNITGAVGGQGSQLTAPTLAWDSDTADATPDLTVDFDATVGSGDNLRFEYGTVIGFAGATVVNHTIDAGEDTANQVALALSSLGNGTYYVRVRTEKSGIGVSAWSNTVTMTISVIVPLALDGSGATDAGSGTSIAVSLTTTAAGVIIVFVEFNKDTTTSVSDGTNTYTLRVREDNIDANDVNIEEWWAVSAGAFSGTVTVNFGASTPFASACAFGIKGANVSSVFDADVSLPNHGKTDPRTVSTTASDTMIIAGFRSSSTSTAGTGFTLIHGTGFLCVEYKIVVAPQTALSVTMGTGAGSSNGCIADAVVRAS